MLAQLVHGGKLLSDPPLFGRGALSQPICYYIWSLHKLNAMSNVPKKVHQIRKISLKFGTEQVVPFIIHRVGQRQGPLTITLNQE